MLANGVHVVQFALFKPENCIPSMKATLAMRAACEPFRNRRIRQIVTKKSHFISAGKMSDHKSSWSLAIAMFVCCWLSSSVASSGVGKCKLKVMTHKARQVDQFGYACEDDVKIYTCGGYCLSSEVSTVVKVKTIINLVIFSMYLNRN